MNTEKEFYKKHSTPGLSKELKNYEESNIKYRYVNPKWMFKVDYDPSTKKITYKDLPDSYYDFLKQIDLNDEKAIDNSSYTIALGRYASEMNDSKFPKTLPDSLTDLNKDEMSAINGYNYRKKVFKGKILDYELTECLKNIIKVNHCDKKVLDDMITDYKNICKNQEYITIINNIYIQIQKLEKGKIAPSFSLKEVLLGILWERK